MAMIVPLLPYYATSLGANATAVGALISTFAIAQLVSAPFWGRLSDRVGRRPAIIAGLLLSGVAYIFFAAADSLALLLTFRIIQGVGGGTIGVVQAYATDLSPPEARTKTLGWLSAITSSSAVLGPVLGSATIAFGGPAAPGIGAAVLAILAAIFASRYLREAVHADHPPDSPAAGATRGRPAIWRVLVPWKDPVSRLIWVYAVGVGAFYGTAPTMPLLFDQRFGITARTVGYLVMYVGAMGFLVRAALLGRIAQRLGEPAVTRWGIVSLAAGLAVLSIARSFPLLFVSLTLMPLGTALLFPCITSLLSRVVAPTERGFYLGVQQAFGSGARVVFPIGAGLLMDRFGLATAFWVACGLVLVTLPLTRRVLKSA
jgi:MFS family permease